MPLLLNLKKHPDYKKAPKQVFALKQTRLISTLGASAVVEPETPTLIPWQLFEAAAQSGCVDYNPAMADAMMKAMAAIESPIAADEKAIIDPSDLITAAVRKVMLMGDESAFKPDGTPKLAAVHAFLDAEKIAAGVTVDIPLSREIVYDVFLELQDVKPADPEPELLPDPDLEGEDSSGGRGGSVWDMLGRIAPHED